jgi:T5SS/PEP-CTERM-associated repeat protein
MAAVDGVGSAFTITGETLTLGYLGSGTLTVGRGASVTASYGVSVGYCSSSRSVVQVDGTGSTWTNGGSLTVGSSGTGTVSFTGGAVASAGGLSINGKSLLAIDVGRSSLLTVAGGAGTLTNNGIARILAGAGVPTDGFQYSPIAAGTWTGTGIYQAVGGTWSTTSHKFTASSVTHGTSGSTVPLELASVQRALVDDSGAGGTNWEVGASFVAAGSTTNISFLAAAMNESSLDTLRSHLSTGESILSGWMFSADGYTVSSSNPVYLSFNVGASHPADELEVWHYDGTSGWAKYGAFDLTYDGTFASFTANSFSGYAMVAVPEPGTLMLLIVGLLGLACRAWRRRRTI